MIPSGTKIKILEIRDFDAHYLDRAYYINQTGFTNGEWNLNPGSSEYYGGCIIWEKPILVEGETQSKTRIFASVKVKIL